MKKKFKMENLDCANCAAKMEDGIKKIEGVKDASVNFMLQKLVIDLEEDMLEQILAEAQKVCSKVDSDCKILV